MRWRRKLMLGATALAMFMVAFLVAGCGDNPVAPLVTDDGTGGFTYVKDKYGDPLASPVAPACAPNGLIGWDKDAALIGSAGGTIDLQLGPHASSLAVPPGALLRPTFITVVAADFATPFGDVAFYDFGPDGLVFRIPAKLTLQVSDPEGTMKRLYWWNPSSHRWQLVNVAPVKDGKVTFTVAHFSKYGIS